jgi:hypothetical protein
MEAEAFEQLQIAGKLTPPHCYTIPAMMEVVSNFEVVHSYKPHREALVTTLLPLKQRDGVHCTRLRQALFSLTPPPRETSSLQRHL